MGKVALADQARKVSSFLGEPGWLQHKRLEAVALLEKRNGSAEVSGFKMTKGRMKVEVKIEGNAVVLPIAEALRRGGALAEQLGKPLCGREPDSYLLSLALFTDAHVIAAGAGAPSRVFLEISGKPPGYFAAFYLFADGAKAAILEKAAFQGSADECRALFLGKGSSVQFCSLQNNGPKSHFAVGMAARQGEGSRLKYLNSNIGGLEKNDSMLFLQEGKGSRCEHYEASLASGKQRWHKDSDHVHLAPGTYSRSLFKYATAGQSQVFVDGKVTIEQSAPGSDTHLLAKSLLLSGNCVSHIVPKLFVHNSEVMAGHGSAMTPIDDEELFYLGSRGIGPAEARRLVLKGFLREALQKSEIDSAIASLVQGELDLSAGKVFEGD